MKEIKARIKQLQLQLNDPEIYNRNRIESKLEAYLECLEYLENNSKLAREEVINLSDLLQHNLAIYGRIINCKDEDYQIIINSMREACRQTLELAAENVGFIETTSEELNSQDYMPFIKADDNTIWTFDKQSILDTINQIK